MYTKNKIDKNAFTEYVSIPFYHILLCKKCIHINVLGSGQWFSYNVSNDHLPVRSFRPVKIESSSLILLKWIYQNFERIATIIFVPLRTIILVINKRVIEKQQQQKKKNYKKKKKEKKTKRKRHLPATSRKHSYIILTPLNPTFIVKLGFTGVYIIFFLICSKHRLLVLTSTNNLCFEQK